MYIGSGDTGTGERRDIRRLNPQRLDTLDGKILRIVPDLREHVKTSALSANGRHRLSHSSSASPPGKPSSSSRKGTNSATRGSVRPTYPVIAYPHDARGGDAIANGLIYRGSRIPSLHGRLIFADITTGRVWYAEMPDVLAAHDDDPTTLAPPYEVDADSRHIVEELGRPNHRPRRSRGRSVGRCWSG